jgi:hypothetical protein
MNKQLRELAQEAGAPQEVIDQLWFNIFCMKFASVILTNAEQEMRKINSRINELEGK